MFSPFYLSNSPSIKAIIAVPIKIYGKARIISIEITSSMIPPPLFP